MKSKSKLRALLSQGFARQPKLGTRRLKSRGLRGELLESRRVLASFLVSTNADSLFAGGTLRSAILQANANPGADQIVFSPATNFAEFDLLFGQMTITDSLTITGNGINNTVIDAQSSFRIFNITGGSVVLENLSLKNGRTTGTAESGGAVSSSSTGTLTIRQSRLTGNSTLGNTAKGGAVYTAYGRITIQQSTLSGNSTAGQDSFGGAVATQRRLDISESILSGNSTTGAGSLGGATYAGGGPGLLPNVISNSTLSGNFTTGLLAHGGAVANLQNDLQIIRSTLSGNSVSGLDTGGGAIYSTTYDNFVNANTLVVRESTLSGNTTSGAGGYGGAILALSRYLTLTQSTISGNAATGPNSDGGAVWVYDALVEVENSTITGNSATRSGGGIGARNASSNVDLTIQNSIIASNTAPSNADFEASAIFGGGVNVRNSLIGRSNGTGLTPTGSTTPDAQGNFVGGSTPATAINPLLLPLANNGGPTQTHALQPNSLAVDRGENDLTGIDIAPLIFDQRGSVFFRIVNGTVDMGAFELQRLTQPIVVSSNLDELDFNLRPGRVSLREAIFLANTIAGANAITFDLSTDDVVFNLPLGPLNITESVTITGNDAINTVIDAAQASRIFEVQAGSLTLNRLKLQNGRTTANSFAGSGGAIFFNSSSLEKLAINESVVSGSSTTGSGAKGGAIYSSLGAITVKQSTISGNSTNGSASSGGGIATQSGAVSLIQSTISGNRALGTNADGGGVWVDNSIVQIINSTITDNFAARSGGGFGVLVDASDKKLTIHNSIIASNSAVVSAPDFRPPISPSINREVRSSLIGSNGGTGLTATIGTTPDANGNFVGGVGTEIDPQLGALTNNGVAVPTHSLLIGSLAIDTGSNARANDVTLPGNPALMSDQRGNPFSRIFNATVDIGAYERIIFSDPLVVSTNVDELDANISSGDLSLREAIALSRSALGSPNITFASSTNAAEFDLALGQFEITTSLTITGNGTASTVIDARQLSRIFAVEAGDLTLTGVTLKNGKTTREESLGRGGAIVFSSTGHLTIQDSLLTGNSTTGFEASGGGIYANSGDVTLTGSTVSGNVTTGNSADGGGISANSGNVTLINSTVSGNSTAGRYSSGGGLFAYTGMVTLTSSTVSGNSTAGDYSGGGGIRALLGNTSLTHSTVSGNTTAGDLSAGGGINSSGNLTLTDSTVSGNRTTGYGSAGGGVANVLGSNITLIRSTVSSNSTSGRSSSGGGVVTTVANVTLTDSSVSNNSTSGGESRGGGLRSVYGNITLTDSSVSSNSTSGVESAGAGIYSLNGSITLTRSVVSGNLATGSESLGGGIYAKYGAVSLTDSNLSGNSTTGYLGSGGGMMTDRGNITLMGSTVSGNTATGAEALGGGILTISGNITVSNSTLSGNQALGVNSEGGGLFFGDSIVKIVNSTITGNSATGAGGGLRIFADANDKKLTIHNSIIAGNTAASNPDFTAPTSPSTNLEVRNSLIGRSDGTTLTATGLTPNTNGNLVGGTTVGTAINPLLGPLASNGGPLQTHALLPGSPAINRGNNALAVDVTQLVPPALPNDQRGKPIARIANLIVDMGAYELFTVGGPIVVSTNVDEFDGNISSGNLSLREAIVLANASPGPDAITFATSTNAAQFDLTLGQLVITESVTITGNGANNTVIDAQQASGIFNFQLGDFTLNSLTLKDGRSTGGGAAIASSSTGQLTLQRTVLSGNTTTGQFAHGGAIYSNSGAVVISQSTLDGNSTTGPSAYGGAIFARYGAVTISQSTLSGNAASGSYSNGGAVYALAGTLTVSQSTLTGNSVGTTSAYLGGAIGSGYSGQLVITNSIIAGNSAGSASQDIYKSSNLTITNSLLGSNSGTALAATGSNPDTNGNLIGTSSVPLNPQLGPLANNGGPIKTHALLASSPAIDRGNNSLAVDVTQIGTPALLTDQRGNPFFRVFNSTVDMGAFELITFSGPIVVSTNADEFDSNFTTGDLSLREAIVLANVAPGVNTIEFANSTIVNPFNLSLGQLEITESVNILGNGGLASNTVIDGQQLSRLFRITSGNVLLQGLTLRNGRTTATGFNGSGGAINFSSPGTLTLNQSVLSGNSTTGDNALGGGIYANYGAVTILSSTLSQNSTSGSSAFGGSIASGLGAVSISDSTLSGNTTTGSFAAGGAVAVGTTFGSLTIRQSSLVGNRTNGSGASGGAVYSTSPVIVSNSTLSGNFVGGSSGNGGAIATDGAFGALTISQSTLSGNAINGDQALGGGAVFADLGSISVRQSTLTLNDAGLSAGGAIFSQSSSLTIRNSIVARNFDNGSAPDVSKSAQGQSFTVSNSLIGRNGGTGLTATSATVPGLNGNLIGGASPALEIDPQLANLASNGGVTKTHALLSTSPAINRGSNALAVDVTQPGNPLLTTDQRGAPFVRRFNPTVDMGSYEFQTLAPAFFVVTTTSDELNYGNTAVSLREAINSANGSVGTNTITFAPSTNGAELDLTLGEMAITETLVISGNGATSTIIDAQQSSRIFNVQGLGDFTLSGVTLKNGRTQTANSSGGAILSRSAGLLNIQNSVLTGNSTLGVQSPGGAVYSDASAVTISQSTLSGNSTTGNDSGGGGIYSLFGNVTLTGSTVSGNSTAGTNSKGGGVSMRIGDLTVMGSTVSGNTTTGLEADGGGSYLYSGRMSLTNSTVSSNSTSGNFVNGGGIAFSLYGSLSLMGSTVSGNSTAGYQSYGGGIFTTDGSVTMSNSTVSGNQVLGGSSDGGGLWFDNSIVTIVNSTITGNTATQAGGGLGTYSDSSDKKLTIHNSIIAGNTAASNPDFIAPATPITNLEVRNSLIGRGDGTTLTATGTTPGANGNLIGGTTAGTAINPQLGALANNGGPTQTHALLINSPAFNRGNNALALDVTQVGNPLLTTDQRGIGFNRTLFGVVDIGAFESAVLDSPEGTTGNDAFVLTYSSNTTSGTVSVTVSTNSGPVTNLGTFPMNSPLTINGLGGTDSVSIVGTAGVDTMTVTNTGLTINGASLILTSIENRTLAGAAGNDIYRFDADAPLGTFTLDEALSGTDTVDLSLTTTVGNNLNLGLATSQIVNANLRLILGSATTFENAIGGSMADTLTGNSLNNTLTGGDGNDTLNGGAGNDILNGGLNDDVYVFGNATAAEDDQVVEAANQGTDTLNFAAVTTNLVLSLGLSTVQTIHANRTLRLNSGAVIENVVGGAGNDTLTGNSLANSLTGGAGNDTLNGGAGSDILTGGLNDDIYVFGNATAAEDDQVIEAANQGTDTLNFATVTTNVAMSLGLSTVQAIHANRTLRLNSGAVIENVVGGAGSDTLTGNSLANSLTGGAGNDTLNGGAGSDILNGGLNDDTYVFGNATAAEEDQVTEAANQGTDTLNFAALTTNVSLSLGLSTVQAIHANRTLRLNSGAVIENAVGGAGSDTLTGNNLANSLTGGAGNDTLIGGAGSDTLSGGLNDDTYVFGNATAAEDDQVTEAANQGTDTLNFSAVTTDVVLDLGSAAVQTIHTNRTLKLNSGAVIENIVGGSANDTLLGNSLANRLTGGNGNNILVGLAGDDILEAGTGRDILIGGQGLDTLNGGTGEDILIAGRTTSDSNIVNLNTIRTEWVSANPYATRITNLRAGVGSPAVSLKATINVLNDAGEDDVLTGGGNTDWYLKAVDDVITDLFAGETIDVL